MAYFTSSDDIIDLRDITDRVDELRSERDNFVLGAPDGSETPNPEGWAEENDDEAEELAMLESLLSDLKGYGGDHQWGGDWYPGSLIADSYFEKAMDELLEDIGDLPKDLPSYLTITVNYDVLKEDYSEVDFDGNTFWYR